MSLLAAYQQADDLLADVGGYAPYESCEYPSLLLDNREDHLFPSLEWCISNFYV